jgi:hypothetical protein
MVPSVIQSLIYDKDGIDWQDRGCELRVYPIPGRGNTRLCLAWKHK